MQADAPTQAEPRGGENAQWANKCRFKPGKGVHYQPSNMRCASSTSLLTRLIFPADSRAMDMHRFGEQPQLGGNLFTAIPGEFSALDRRCLVSGSADRRRQRSRQYQSNSAACRHRMHRVGDQQFIRPQRLERKTARAPAFVTPVPPAPGYRKPRA